MLSLSLAAKKNTKKTRNSLFKTQWQYQNETNARDEIQDIFLK